MRKKWAFVAAAAAAAVIALPMAAVASQNESGVTFGSHQLVTGPGSAAGSFAAVGDIDDSGTVQSSFTLTPLGNQDAARLSGTSTYTTALGTFQTTFSGISSPAAGARAAARGTFEFVGGTGAYAEIRGHGTFTAVGDFTTGNVYATGEGQAQR